MIVGKSFVKIARMHEPIGALSDKETEELCLIPIWISILIAGADNNIEKREIKKAIASTREICEQGHTLVKDYYRQVSEKFEKEIKGYVTLLPEDHNKRVQFLLSKLARVNYFFSKLEQEMAYQMYLSFRDLANKVAKASGGIFGLLSVSFAESKYVDLKMIDDPSGSQI